MVDKRSFEGRMRDMNRQIDLLGRRLPRTRFASPEDTLAGLADNLAVTPEGLTAWGRLPVIGQIPSSIVVGSGSASVSSDGTVTFTNCASVSWNDVFDGLGGDMYEWIVSMSSYGAALRFRVAGADRASGYSRAAVYKTGWDSSAPLGGYSSPSNELLYLAPSQIASRVFGSTKFFQPRGIEPAALSLATQRNGSAQYVWTEQGTSSVTVPAGGYTGFTLVGFGGNMTGVAKLVKLA